MFDGLEPNLIRILSTIKDELHTWDMARVQGINYLDPRFTSKYLGFEVLVMLFFIVMGNNVLSVDVVFFLFFHLKKPV